MGKKLILAILFVSLVFGVQLSAEADREEVFTSFLPVVSTPPPRTGLAWCAGCDGRNAGDLATYGAHYWYATVNPPQKRVYQGGQLPIVRSRHSVEDVEGLAATGYEGPALWLNEPELGGLQDDFDPAAAALIWPEVQAACPKCKWVMPNISHLDQGTDWLREFVAEHNRLWGKDPEPWAWSFHLYWSPAGPHLDDKIEEVCSIVDCKRLWLTEWGSCSGIIAEEYFKAVRDNLRFDVIMYFTNRNSLPEPMTSCSALLNEDGSETFYGELYRKIFQ